MHLADENANAHSCARAGEPPIPLFGKILTSRAGGERLVALPAACKTDQAGMRRAPCCGALRSGVRDQREPDLMWEGAHAGCHRGRCEQRQRAGHAALAGNRSAAARAGSVAGLQPARITMTVLYVGSSPSRSGSPGVPGRYGR